MARILGRRLASSFATDGREPCERERLVELMVLFARLPPPPDPFGLVPRWAELHDAFLGAAHGTDWEATEEAFLLLYAHLHGHEAPYTVDERRRVDETGGYWNHAGGISPVIRAAPFVRPDTVSMDLGAGNGLQLMLVQRLHPHATSIQVEMSSTMVEAGRLLAGWLGLDPGRLLWQAMDVMDADIDGVDLIYMYRPVRPTGPGEAFYHRLAHCLSLTDREVVVMSIADCLARFAQAGHEVLFSDGQLTVMRFGLPGGPAGRLEP